MNIAMDGCIPYSVIFRIIRVFKSLFKAFVCQISLNAKNVVKCIIVLSAARVNKNLKMKTLKLAISLKCQHRYYKLFLSFLFLSN
jgi:hypothetical protein